MKLQHWILMTLMDGKPRKLGDLMPFLLRKVDSQAAVKVYLRSSASSAEPGKRGGVPPLEKQLRLGKRRALVTAVLSALRGQGHSKQKPPLISAEKPTEGARAPGKSGPAENWILQLTPAGKVALESKVGHSATKACVWKCLQHALANGDAVLSLSFPVQEISLPPESTEEESPSHDPVVSWERE